jgi:hypothetical protein
VAPAKLANLARMTTATTGTGTITLGAAVPGYLTFADAGIVNGDVVSYGIADGNNSEVGTGTYTAAGTTLTRTVTNSTNAGAAIALSGTAQVFICIRNEDYVARGGDTMTGRLGLATAGFQLADKANIFTRTDSGFFQTSAATLANGWPLDSGWAYMIAATHTNDANYYSMQIASGFAGSTNFLFWRNTEGSGSSTTWSAIWDQKNNGSIKKVDPHITLDKSNNPGLCNIRGQTNGLVRWQLLPGNNALETGSNSGSDFEISRHNDAGTYLGSPLTIFRVSGAARFSHGFTTNMVTPGTYPGNTNTIVGFEIDTTPMLFSSVTASWNANWNRNSDGTIFSFTKSGGGWSGSISIAATTTYYNTSSGAELKEDLKSFDAANIIDDTNVYDFAWKDTGERAFGVIAQEAVNVYPQAVTHFEASQADTRAAVDDWWGVDYSKYVPVILQELKSLRDREKKLVARVEALEAALTKLTV